MSFSSLFVLSSVLISSVFGQEACCLTHEDNVACLAEMGAAEPCIWLDAGNPLLAQSAGVQCVSTKWATCQLQGICPPPKPGVVPACSLETCTNDNYVVNVGVIVDESGSVGHANYMHSLDFVEEMALNDINDVSPVSILAFSKYTDKVSSFTTSKSDLAAAITAERSDYADSITCTGLAIKEMIDEMSSEFGKDENNVIFLMTDGAPYCTTNAYYQHVCHYKAALDSAGIKMYIVGISNGFVVDKVDCLVDSPADILQIKDFQPKNFYKIQSKLRKVVCPIVYKDDENPLAEISQRAAEQKRLYQLMEQMDSPKDSSVLAVVNDQVMDSFAYQFASQHGQTMIWLLLSVSAVIIAFAVCFRRSLCAMFDNDASYKLLPEPSTTRYDAI